MWQTDPYHWIWATPLPKMLLGCLNGKLTAIHGGGDARLGAALAIFDLHVDLEVVDFWPLFGEVSVPHSLPMAIAAKHESKKGAPVTLWGVSVRQRHAPATSNY